MDQWKSYGRVCSCLCHNIIITELLFHTTLHVSLKEKSDRETCSVFLLLQVRLGHYLSVEQVDDTVSKAGIVLRVRHHDDGSTLLVQLF